MPETQLVTEREQLADHAFDVFQNGTVKLQDVEAGTFNHLYDHCHEIVKEEGIDRSARNKLIFACVFCLSFMICEIIGGAIARSLAIMADAAHLLTDVATFLISLLALYMATKPSTKRLNFGYHRTEVMGALISVLMIWLVTGILVYLAINRILYSTFEINGKVMLITSAIGVGFNITMVSMLHNHGHRRKSAEKRNTKMSTVHTDEKTKETHQDSVADMDQIMTVAPATTKRSQNITVRAAFIHVIGDLVQSIGVFTAAIIIYFKPSFKIVDPICTFLFSILVLFTTTNILRDALCVLMEAKPRELNFLEIKEALQNITGVVGVHDLRIWSLTLNKSAVTAHLVIDLNAKYQEILKAANLLLWNRFHVYEVTLQLEQYVPKMANCQKCNELKV